MTKAAEHLEANESQVLTCGLVMPISEIEGCTESHWADVKEIITEAMRAVGGYKFDVRLVSDGDAAEVIHKRIVQGLSDSDIVICDVSCKNPNVMFELGLRLAFDKPTIIIKDDKTNYTFDIGGIEHLTYPRDLRYAKMNVFKENLGQKVVATYKASKDPSYTSFLKHFQNIKVASIEEKEVPFQKAMFDLVKELQTEVAQLRQATNAALSNAPKLHSTIAEAPNPFHADTNMLFNALARDISSSKGKTLLTGGTISNALTKAGVFENK